MEKLVVVRGGGDLATGTIYKLYKSGFKVLVLEIENPSAIRRNVAFCEAVYEGIMKVEDVICYKAKDFNEAKMFLNEGKLTLLVDENGDCIEQLKPNVVIDAIIAKKNLGFHKDMAPITIALGPGFNAGSDCDVVIETKRGHHLGRIIDSGYAIKNTGIPGIIGGYGKERVIHSPAKGVLKNVKHITDIVKKGEVIAYIDDGSTQVPVYASLDGLLRGLIRDGYYVSHGFKIADIDPRADEYNNCFTISDKARCIAGGVLEAILYLSHKKGISL